MRCTIGVVVVAFNSADVIGECLESLFASNGIAPHVVVVDNRSQDETIATIENWASTTPIQWRANVPLTISSVQKPVAVVKRKPGDPAGCCGALTLVQSPVNGGFAYGVNLGISALLDIPDIDFFWLLNPDCIVAANTASKYFEEARKGLFGILTSRTVYYDRPEIIQSDGGRIDRSATCRGLNNGKNVFDTPLPESAELDYASGANMVVSRKFIEQAGLMEEKYFLYYEEVDWAMKRGDLAIRIVPDAVVYHHGGTTIGTGSPDRRPQPFANYFNYRNRMRFARRHMPATIPFAVIRALVKAAVLFAVGARDEARAILQGTFGLTPSLSIQERVRDAAARKMAFELDQ